jgi:hypothetical protein
MKLFSKKFSLIPAVLSFFVCLSIQAQTLDELVTKEEGTPFGECRLSPAPKMAGEKIVVVIPARFEDPSSWVTHSVLLVALNAENIVQGELEFKIPQGISPKEVISVECVGSEMKIKVPGPQKPRTQTYKWDGTTLQEIKKVKIQSKK